MKKLMFIFLLLTACDTSNRIFRDGEKGNTGTSCTVSQTIQGALISCTDGTSALVTNGSNGTTGQDGSSCSVMEALDNSGALILCEDGTSVFVKHGEKGNTGDPGQNAESVTMVQLCPNIVGSYPNEFPEYAFNIGGLLYATMNKGSKAWTSRLYPGIYTTTSSGINCVFTINQNGELE